MIFERYWRFKKTCSTFASRIAWPILLRKSTPAPSPTTSTQTLIPFFSRLSGKGWKSTDDINNQKNYFFCGKLITLMGVWKLRCNHKDLHNVNCFLKICWTLISMDIIVQSIHVQMLVWQYISLVRPLSTNVCTYSWY